MRQQPPPWVGMVAIAALILGLAAGLLLILAAGSGGGGTVPAASSVGERGIGVPPGDTGLQLQRWGWGLFIMFLAVGGYAVTRILLALAGSGPSEASTALLHDVHEELRKHTRQLKEMYDILGLSDGAKAIAFRGHDRDALRKAIKEDLEQQDWEAAYFLVDEMERRFGYRQEAEGLRAEIDKTRQRSLDRKVDEALEQFDRLLSVHDWTRAKSEAERLAKTYPAHPRVQGLSERLDLSRSQYKLRLIRDFKSAAERKETDKAMEVLRELDKYLSPGEASAYKDVAMGVIRDRQGNLQVSFTMAWNAGEWHTALETADQIIQEFPSSKMADEVRERLPQLRERAGIAVRPG